MANRVSQFVQQEAQLLVNSLPSVRLTVGEFIHQNYNNLNFQKHINMQKIVIFYTILALGVCGKPGLSKSILRGRKPATLKA